MMCSMLERKHNLPTGFDRLDGQIAGAVSISQGTQNLSAAGLLASRQAGKQRAGNRGS
jgi:hypothetical protein